MSGNGRYDAVMNDEPRPDAANSDELGLEPTEGIDITDGETLPAPLDETAGMEAPPAAEPTPAPPTTPTTIYKGSGFRWSMLFGAILLTIVIILVVQNTGTVDFKFLQWKVSAPLAAILLGTTLIAVIIDEIVGYVIRIRRRKLKQQLAELKELKAQLSPPVKRRRFGKKKS